MRAPKDWGHSPNYLASLMILTNGSVKFYMCSLLKDVFCSVLISIEQHWAAEDLSEIKSSCFVVAVSRF